MSPRLRSDRKSLVLLGTCLNRLHRSSGELKQIHAHLLISGGIFDPFATGKLISSFSAVDLNHALLLFRHLPHSPSTFLWNTLIGACTGRNQPLIALSLFSQMLAAVRLPNNYTFSFLLRSCISISSLFVGQQIHAQIEKLGWADYDFVMNGLLHLYATCGRIGDAQKLFDVCHHPDVVTWSAMVNGYVKAGQIGVARGLFDVMPERNAVSWSTMITAYAAIGMFHEALDAFNEMQVAGLEPNHAGLVGALSACGFLGALDQGKWIHAFVERNGMELDRILGTALIDMYAKCGCIDNADRVFGEMTERDVFAYTAMISGLSNHGLSEKAIEMFARMEAEGVKPNAVTFICILSACGRLGLVELGRHFFERMSRVYGIEPGVEHYGCLVDLLARAGLIDDARRLIREMSMEPDSYVLGALLNACRVLGEVEVGKEIVESLMELGLDHSGVHVLLSNMYASSFRWEEVKNVRRVMEENKVRKVPGCSMIEVDGVACEFVAGDRSHPCMDKIIVAMKGMDKQLKSFGDDKHLIHFVNL
ncbi:pentatricopeptide repeat-containing protein At5g66520-like [Phalaenopsis equestris]|uniref:pentatricopeptide repeat-containing protein At5g66520-like n=1 Tax=Phalaenopsis equestris TaxID=78828 RepID=UPI0009E253D5|nr:pentatricopeptide repeat-containing protein At5g66520-like [Phalaenopsis equestris]